MILEVKIHTLTPVTSSCFEIADGVNRFETKTSSKFQNLLRHL